MSTSIIETDGLTRQFGDVVAVEDVALRVREGSVYGFLGRNGAGKTTTLRLLLGLLKPSQGQVRINGFDLARHRRQAVAGCGVLLEADGFYRHLSGYANLDLYRRMLGLSAQSIVEALEIVGLAGQWKKKVSAYSLGMRQRLGIARALLSRPSVLILDEPTNGLDPDGILDIRRLLKELPKRTAATILVSSHLLSEVEIIADDVGIIEQGRLVAQGSLQGLAASMPTRLRVGVDQPEAGLTEIRALGCQAQLEDGCVWVTLEPGENPRMLAQQLSRTLCGLGLNLHELSHEQHSLEQFFHHVTASAVAEEGAA
jgi:ABC-2 type transport system ATP-binding protein